MSSPAATVPRRAASLLALVGLLVLASCAREACRCAPNDTGPPPDASCSVGAGHTCARWIATEPRGEIVCLGYDGAGVVCSGVGCGLAPGHTCARWLYTEPSGALACVDYDGAGIVCAGSPPATCDIGAGHVCSRWRRTEPNGDWMCLSYDGAGVVCM